MSTEDLGDFTTMDDMARKTFEEPTVDIGTMENDLVPKDFYERLEAEVAAEPIRIKSTMEGYVANSGYSRPLADMRQQQLANEALDLAIRAGPTDDLIARAKAFYAFLSNPSA